MVRKVLLYLWQLPQNLIGLLVILFTRARKVVVFGEQCWNAPTRRFGVSLGNYVILGGLFDSTTLHHEVGHQKQSLYLGWLYLIIIGLPSALGNIYDRIFHRMWNYQSRIRWYYSQPWEAWADRLGGVER